MKYLLIDTSATKLFVALLFKIEDNLKIISLKEQENSQNLSVVLLPLIDETLKEGKTTIHEIDKIFVTNGPGSFTGIRIGLAVAKTIGWGLSIPLIPISTLEVMASGFDCDVIPVIDARNDNVYAGFYDKDLNKKKEDLFTNFSKLKQDYPNTLIVSYDTKLQVHEANANIIKVVLKHEFDKPVNPHSCNPNYLKQTEAERNLNHD